MKNKQFFITQYLSSLSERTERLKNGDLKIGFDWIIYQYGFFRHWQQIRQPFSIEGKDKIITHKTEPEFGIDFCFYDDINKEIIVFVLKAEKLTYSNWISKNFCSDIERAIHPNLEKTGVDVDKIEKYKVIVVYNKTDDENGKECFDAFVKSSSKTIYDGKIKVLFERWNIDRFSSEVTKNLLIPDVLPSHLSSLLAYITYLFKNIEYGTTAWDNQLLPNFKNFLNLVFNNGIDERKLYLIPFALSIIKGDKDNSNSKVAWIELIEWSILKLLDITLNSNRKIKNIVDDIWNNFYIEELSLYFEVNRGVLCSKNGIIVSKTPCSDLILINTINSAYWHIGRLVLLAISRIKIDVSNKTNSANYYCNYLIAVLNGNSSIFYPIIDLHHIQLFMIFYLFYLSNRMDVFYSFINDLISYLVPRKFPDFSISFINSSNDLTIVADWVTKQIKIPQTSNESSYLLTMLLEICLIFDEEKATKIIDDFFEGVINENKKIGTKQINLVSWLPDEDWEEKIFKKQIQTGIGISTGNFSDFHNKKSKYENIKSFIDVSEEKDIDVSKLKCPFPSYLLACIKNKSPLPPAFWRQFLNI